MKKIISLFAIAICSVLFITFAVSENISELPDGCEVMDDIGEFDENHLLGEIIATTCGPAMIGYAMSCWYNWDTNEYYYFCTYTGHVTDYCLTAYITLP